MGGVGGKAWDWRAWDWGGRGIKILRCGAKRLVAAFAGTEKTVNIGSLSTKVDIRRFAPQRRTSVPRSELIPSCPVQNTAQGEAAGYLGLEEAAQGDHHILLVDVLDAAELVALLRPRLLGHVKRSLRVPRLQDFF